MTSPFILCGLNDAHINWGHERQRLQAQAGKAFEAMQNAAKNDGHNLQIASGFRDYHRQAAIWQRKTTDITADDDRALHAVLHWSAMPGASRHHWGTDMDVYDPDALKGAPLQLIPKEYSSQGPLNAVYRWLEKHAARYDFFWPYDIDRGGVAAEPWHLSYAPIADDYLRNFTPDVLRTAWQEAQPLHYQWLAKHCEVLIQRYVQNIGQR